VIYDGYTRRIRLLDGTRTINVLYRPATALERDMAAWVWDSLSDDAAEREIYFWVSKHIDVCDAECGSWWSTPDGLRDFDHKRPDVFKELVQAIQGVIPDSSGETWAVLESAYNSNLVDGLKLLKVNRKLANRDCGDCQKHWYNESTGDVIKENSTGLPMERISPPACRTQTGCLKGTPERQRSLNRANRMAVKHYFECRATGTFPDDPLVKEHAVIIERVLGRKAVTNA